MKLRSKVAVLLAEFLGTAILATAAINIARSQIGISYFVAIGVGITLTVLVLMLARVSGSHLNPAITLGLWTVRKINTIKALAYVSAQMLGGLAAWQLANYFLGSEIPSIAPGKFEWSVLVGEAAGVFVFAFAIAAALYQNFEDGKKAVLIGGGLAVGIIVASLASNAALNPAVALANQTWSKAYVFGPLIGGIIGFNVYVLFFAPLSELIPAKLSAVKSTASSATKAKKSTAKVVKTKSTTAKKTTTKAATKKSPAKKSTAKKK